jgi:hypothetical protein
MEHDHTVVHSGIMAGGIGAISVIIWFSFIDMIVGRPFFTPAALGSAVFFGISDPTMITVSILPVLGYTVIHFFVFFVVATIAALIFRDSEKNQGTLVYALEFFIALEVLFYFLVGLLFTPLLAELAWINIAIGNVISSVGMGIYFYRTEPVLKKGLF